MLGNLTDSCDIPDQVGTVSGWRVWNTYEGMLRSPVIPTAWPPGQPFVARHLSASTPAEAWWRIQRLDSGSLELSEDQQAAQPCTGDCGCGVNAWDSEQRMLELDVDSPLPVYGRATMWGRVRQYELGLRSTHAYPAELFVDPDCFISLAGAIDEAERIAERYGVSCQVRRRGDAQVFDRSSPQYRREQRKARFLANSRHIFGRPAHDAR